MKFLRTISLCLGLLIPSGLFSQATTDAVLTLTIEQCVNLAMNNGPDAALANLTWQQNQLTWAQTQAQNGLSLSTGAGYAPSTSTKGNTNLSTGSAATLEYNSNGLQFNPVNHNLNANLTLSGPQTAVKLGATQVIPSDDPANQNTQLGLTVTQTIFDGIVGGKLSSTLEQARLQLEIQRLTWQDALATVRYNVQLAALTLIGAQRAVEAKQVALDNLNSEADQTALMRKAGMATQLDVNQAHTAAESAQLDLASAINDRETAQHTLAILMGWNIEHEYSLAVPPTNDQTLPDRSAVLAVALTHRSELKSWQLSRQSAEIDLKLKQAATLPTINLSGTVNWRHGWADGNLNALSMNGGANIDFVLADGGNNQALIQAGKASLAASDLQKQQISATISQDINSALFGVRDSLDRRSLAQRSLDDAKAAWDQAQLKLDAGLDTHIDVLTALVAWTQAKFALTTAINTVETAWLKLYKAEGLSL